MYIFVTPTKTLSSSNILYQKCVIYLHLKCKILSTFVKANNSYSNFCVKSPRNISVSGLVFDVIHKYLKLKCFGVTSHKPL